MKIGRKHVSYYQTPEFGAHFGSAPVHEQPPPVQAHHFTTTKPDSKVGERTKTGTEPSTFLDKRRQQHSTDVSDFSPLRKSTFPLACSGPTEVDFRFDLTNKLRSSGHALVQRQSMSSLPPSKRTILQPPSRIQKLARGRKQSQYGARFWTPARGRYRRC